MNNREDKKLIIAIDGYSSTGKSTAAKLLAARLGYVYIDTGAMYRAVTLLAIWNKCLVAGIVDEAALKECLSEAIIHFRNSDGHSLTFLNGECVEDEIRGMEVSSHVSLIASLPFVRASLVEKQREMGMKGGVVMDGRDIGSVVFPNADVKFFMTASLTIRAERRYKELDGKGEKVSYQEVEENISKRDYLDESREVSPLRRVEDAVVVDNSHMNIEEELDFMLKEIAKRITF